LVDGLIERGKGLSLYPLRSVDEKNGSFDSGERAGHFVLEIHVSWGIDEIEFVAFSLHSGRSEFDGDSAFLFDIHTVEDLVVVEFADGAGEFEHSIGEGGFSVVDVGDDTEVADMLHRREKV
jgi:hypothetical protein